MIREVRLIGIEGIPEVKKGDELAHLIMDAANKQGTPLQGDDALIVTQKVVSKAEGRLVELGQVEPTDFARTVGRQLDKDPRLVEVILRESRRIVRMDKGILVTETKHGYTCANAGVDASNIPGEEVVALLPEDPDRSASQIRDSIHKRLGIWVAVLISDTFGRPWREGTTDVAIGVAGLNPLIDYRGTLDTFGHLLKFSITAIADELTSASDLVAAKTLKIPVVIIRGASYGKGDYTSGPLLRKPDIDLFR